MLRVYHFVLDHRIGGPHVYVDTLRNALSATVESIVVTTGRGPMTELSLPNLRHLWAPFYVLELVVNTLLLTVAVMVGRIRRENVVFNVHGGANIAPILAARLSGIPVLWLFHETTPQFRRLVDFGRWVLKGGRYALAVVAEKSKEAYGLDDAEFLPAAVDSEFWSRDKALGEDLAACGWMKTTDNQSAPLRLLVVGNLNPLKGLDVLLRALAEIDGPWHLKIVGAPLSTHQSYAESLYQMAAALSLKQSGTQIDFLGWQDRTQVRVLLASCDIFVLPSRSEACPIALLEAMSMGSRCLAADVGDVRLMMKDYPNSKIFSIESTLECRQGINVMRETKGAYSDADAKIGVGSPWSLASLSGKAEALYSRLCRRD